MYKYAIIGSHPAAASVAYHLARTAPRVCLVKCETSLPTGPRPISHRGRDGIENSMVKETMCDMRALSRRYQIDFDRKGSLRLGRSAPTDMRKMKQQNIVDLLNKTAPALMEHFAIPKDQILGLDTRDGLLDASTLTAAYEKGFQEYGGVIADQSVCRIESSVEDGFIVRTRGEIIRANCLVKVGGEPCGEPLRVHRWTYRLPSRVPEGCPSISVGDGVLTATGDRLTMEAHERPEGILLASCRALQALVPRFADAELLSHSSHPVGDTCSATSLVQRVGRLTAVRGATAYSAECAGGIGRAVASQLSGVARL